LKHLERHGARVTCASDGAEAVRLANCDAFDVIILDIRMPVLDGLAAAYQIRAAESAGERTPLVALTANAFASDRRAAVEAGIDYFIAKPVDPFDLVALIETALTRSHQFAGLRPTGS
jgi:CheY-like chemotaxis protein